MKTSVIIHLMKEMLLSCLPGLICLRKLIKPPKQTLWSDSFFLLGKNKVIPTSHILIISALRIPCLKTLKHTVPLKLWWGYHQLPLPTSSGFRFRAAACSLRGRGHQLLVHSANYYVKQVGLGSCKKSTKKKEIRLSGWVSKEVLGSAENAPFHYKPWISETQVLNKQLKAITRHFSVLKDSESHELFIPPICWLG